MTVFHQLRFRCDYCLETFEVFTRLDRPYAKARVHPDFIPNMVGQARERGWDLDGDGDYCSACYSRMFRPPQESNA